MFFFQSTCNEKNFFFKDKIYVTSKFSADLHVTYKVQFMITTSKNNMEYLHTNNNQAAQVYNSAKRPVPNSLKWKNTGL